MQRRSIIILTFICLLMTLPRGFAEEELSYDELGCHRDEVTDSIICDKGPLKGREFLSKGEAQEELVALKKKASENQGLNEDEKIAPAPADFDADEKSEPPAQPAKSTPDRENLKVISWNVKALAHEGSDYDRAALVLGDADVVALQEIDLNQQGKGFLNVIANLVQAKTQEKICRAWVQGGNGERQSYGFMWKESTVGYVNDDGEMKETCGATGLTIRQSKKMKGASGGTFYFKAQKKMFVLGSMFSEGKMKSPDKNVNDVFKSFADEKWPVLVAGDLKLGPSNAAFNGARKMGFHSALKGGKSGWDNFWFRSAALVEAKPVNLYERFADVGRPDIEKTFGKVFPIMGKFNLKEEPKDSVEMVKKKTPAKKKSKSAKR